MKEKMLKFLDEQPNPIYHEEKQIIREFIETFFTYYKAEKISSLPYDDDEEDD